MQRKIIRNETLNDEKDNKLYLIIIIAEDGNQIIFVHAKQEEQSKKSEKHILSSSDSKWDKEIPTR